MYNNRVSIPTLVICDVFNHLRLRYGTPETTYKGYIKLESSLERIETCNRTILTVKHTLGWF